MLADTAKYLLTIADFDPKNVEITVFSGIDAIINAPRTSEERLHGLHFPSKRGAEINVGGHTIQIIYRDKEGDISATTVDGNMIKMNDPENAITIQNSEQKAASANVRVGVRAESGTRNSSAGTDGAGGLEINIFDHFGLDIDDIKRFGLPELVSNSVKDVIKIAALRISSLANIAAQGFRAWFILQHYYGYLPFINIITETHSLDMDFTNTTGSIGG